MASRSYAPNTPVTSHLLDEKARLYTNAESPSEGEEARLQQARAWDKRVKIRIRRLRTIQRTGNLIASVMVLGVMLNTFITFINHKIVYPKEPLLWPTFMMIGTSSVSLLFNFAIIFSYYWGVGVANRADSYAGYWGYLVHLLNFGVWLATSTTFKMMEGDPSGYPTDLWGWTCSDVAAGLQDEFNNVVDFNLQCNTQLASFIMGLINAGLEAFAIVIICIAFRRYRHKKKMVLMEERIGGARSP